MARYDRVRDNSCSVTNIPLILRAQHFQHVASVTHQFNLYMKEVHGKDNPERAHQNSERADDFDDRPSYPDHWSPRVKHQAPFSEPRYVRIIS
ncbi:hypothetical protein F4819DRAFT_454618 [Hypoxylon fuscum]|nr:hypothetical protein F4819DRAFT_454618 [Hypoxylon fuscum]